MVVMPPGAFGDISSSACDRTSVDGVAVLSFKVSGRKTIERVPSQAANIKAMLAKRAADAVRRRHRVEAPSTPTPSEAKPHTDQQVRHALVVASAHTH
jgi:hypothetical protein